MLVRYGRRCGQAKESRGRCKAHPAAERADLAPCGFGELLQRGTRSNLSDKEHTEEGQVLYPPLLPSKVDLRQVSIIPYNEWERIQDSLDSLTAEAACLRAEKKAKKEMHVRSQDMVKHWTNTYAGMKKQKLEAKKKRDEEKEAERQILDVEEAIHKQRERKKAIEYAKQYQFYQTERVKNFHSGLLVSRVIKERDAQTEFQKNEIKSDKRWEEQLKFNIKKAFKEEQEKAEKRRRDRVALANDHLRQIKEHKEEEERRRKLEEKDTEEIKRQNSLYETEMRNKLEKKKEAMNESRRLFFMKNKEEEERQRKTKDKEQLLAIMKADEIFQEHEKEKKLKADKKHREVQDAHIQQMAKNKFNAKKAKQAELDYYRLTEALVAEKEKEFQDYAREVIRLESESTNKYIYPLIKAVQEGPGSGHGPVFVDRGGLRPSYQANDATGVQLPFFNSQQSKYSNFQKSKGRLGFTW
ncbi:cilia- and flagella- associated protein 210 isoform X6 [Manis javanica]|uniref:cilia- and flagella- associated protein 210 isoform X6 n=1 Tax=Manis javanica TaxID=9974 RepID=UPI003C6D716F